MSLNREIMNEGEEQAPESVEMTIKPKNNPSINVPSINLAELKRQSSFQGSPRSHKGLGKSSSVRCLCSPTTHAGSFRCRQHRTLGMSRAGSVGSNLSLLGANKSNPIGESKLSSCHPGIFH